MTNNEFINDLVVLVADKNMEYAVRGILSRTDSLNIREVSALFHVHPEHDPGCFLRGHLFLNLYIKHCAHALILLDREGSGQENLVRDSMEAEIERQLTRCGWGDRAAAIVIEPELDIWVWSNSPHVDSVLGWEGKSPKLRDRLRNEEYLLEGVVKPERPKEALEFALRIAHKPRSSSLYRQIAQKVSLERCIDPSFVKLKSTLQKWFAIESL